MADTTLSREDIRLNINPDSGVLALQLGSIFLKGSCHATIQLVGRKPEIITGSRLVEYSREPISDIYGTGTMLSVRFADEQHDLGLRMEAIVYDNQPFIALRLGLLNHGIEQIDVHRLTLLKSEQIGFGQGPLDGWVNGFHSWSFNGYVSHTHRQPRMFTRFATAPQAINPTTPYPSMRGQYVAEWVGALIDPGVQALVAGFVGVEDQFGQVIMDGRPRQKALTLENTVDGIPMVSGELLWSEWAILYRVKLPHSDPLGIYANAVTKLTPPRVPSTPPRPGWSSWYQFFDKVTAEDMRRNQESLKKLHDQIPLELVQLDDGYQPTWGDWLEHNTRFPDGVRDWAGTVRADGFEPGLWLSPFTVEPRSNLFKSFPEALIRNERGKPVHGGHLLKRRLYGLDPTHPTTQDMIRQVFETIVYQWGIRYLKLDFLYCGALPGKRHNSNLTRAQALRSGLQLIRDVVGEDAVILGCGCPLGPALGIVDILRVGADVAPFWYPEMFGIKRPLRDDFSVPSARNSISTSLNRMWTHRRWWWIDADNLLVREEQELTEDEVKTLTSVIGQTGSHLIVSDDLPVTSYDRLIWASSLLPLLPGEVQIPALFEQTTPETIVSRFHGPAGSHVTAGLINWDMTPKTLSIHRSELGLPLGIPVFVYDFWEQTLAISETDTLHTGELPPHGMALLGLRPVVPGPQLAGSSFHISMGREISMWEVWTTGLKFTISLNRRAKGSLWLKLPSAPTSAVCDGNAIEIMTTDQPDIYVLRLSVNGEATVTLTFDEPPE